MSSLPISRQICIYGDIGSVPIGPLRFVDAMTGEEILMTEATIYLRLHQLPIIEYTRSDTQLEEAAELVTAKNGHLDKTEII